MSSIKLPKRFKDKLDQNQFLDGLVKSTLAQFAEILEDNTLYFFEEYTDHGIRHIESVISSSDNLIPEDTFDKVMHANDVGYYCLTVILHDIGMHLGLEGFTQLLNGRFDDIKVTELDKLTWKELWEDYTNEARKFSGKQLKSIFGDEATIIRNPPIQKPGEINTNDRKLIGEFIRRHHARLAHEIAIKGFPGKTLIPFVENMKFEVRYLIGLIARSHGIDLRKCIDHLELYFGKATKRVIHHTHAVYLMTLLRNADYLQIDSSRTSQVMLKLKTFASPVSAKEHGSHMAVDSIDLSYQDDPERVYVNASPQDSAMYLKLQKLIRDIQYELDVSWAVLGELYGNMQRKPALKYRRITSNLEDKSFTDKQHYLTDSFSYKANDDIVKLLIAPLYGDDPSYGVREMLQNAVDACREREYIENQASRTYIAKVTVEVLQERDGQHYFVISDNGIGMDVNVIKNYFLSAGASFRKSMDWQKRFVDDKGESRVTRSGRFGVGFLAAFLIGDEILVKTRKLEQTIGYHFESHINDEQINILKDTNIAFGTSIRIKLTPATLAKLDPNNELRYNQIAWHKWYNLRYPEISYIYLGIPIEPVKFFFPGPEEDVTEFWGIVPHEKFNRIFWAYDTRFNKRSFVCNGILVKDSGNELDTGLISYRPVLSVFDNNGLLPLTLDRNSFSSSLPFEDELKVELYKDFIAFLLTFKMENPVGKRLANLRHHSLPYPGSYYETLPLSYGDNGKESDRFPYYSSLNRYRIVSVLSSKKGFILNYAYFLNKLKKVNVIMIQSQQLEIKDTIDLDIEDAFLCFIRQKLNSVDDLKQAVEPYSYHNTVENINNSSTVHMKKNRFKFMFDLTQRRISESLRSICEEKGEVGNWISIAINGPVQSTISTDFLKKYDKQINFIREYELRPSNEGDTIMNNLMQIYLGDDVLIPYELEERKKKFPLAFAELGGYMSKYLRLSKSLAAKEVED